jgi:spore coat polysaccharide biosynthesis protein SpsF
MIINIIIQARSSSKRYPSKILRTLVANQVLIMFLINKLKKIKSINKVIVATTIENSDKKLCNILKKNNIFFFRGPLNNVYERFRICLIKNKCDFFIRISSDSPYLDINLLQLFISTIKKNPTIDILTNIKKRTFPKGQSIEIFKTLKFLSIKNFALDKNQKEHVTKYFYDNYEKFNIRNIELNEKINLSKHNCCIDLPKDIYRTKKYLNNLEIKNLYKKIKLF